ncbi:uncharacterized protein LY89DRAFT_657159 [Mollisia scopiformis]|uniref:SET domain-containing protein n=1 Tax=Mollisia scopiformis TaxID=149040 RepID=A0A132BBA5_MOLSC|nr:uncharacterized protein LY89DRAFT_657159 [Mollisia scopiformis]KUJ09695.1 hypothetical protein LY89DRAFT_657159 [Mollisia scopiformis]
MDLPWLFSTYTPSSACEISPHVPLSPDHFATESDEVIALTQSLASLPYDPETWLNRAHSLRLLGYPELSLGDAYKARLLVEAGLDPMPSILGEDVRKASRKKIHVLHTTDPAWKRWAHTVSTPQLLAEKVGEMLKRLELQVWTELMEGLMAANCARDYQRLAREAVEKFPEDEFFPSEVVNANSWFAQRKVLLEQAVERGEMSEGSAETTLGNGGVYPVAYPWMSEGNGFLGRSEEVFEGIQEDFRRVSDNCMVVRSTIRNTPAGDGQEATTEEDCIGAIATRPILAGETILIDSMSTGTVGVDADPDGCPTCCASPVSNFWNTCCPTLYCSQTCASLALSTFHAPLCGKDVSYLYEAAKKATATTDFSLDALLLLRVLALTLEEAKEHPLLSKVLVRLTPAYGFKNPNLIIFNFTDHIQTPTSILLTLGIDVFAAPTYDTWVLHTIKCRLQNNKHGQTLGDWPGTSISGLYSMLNHSCEPNVDWRHESASCAVTMFATREVAVGEELCISYIGARGDGLGVRERRRMLMGWFGMDCGCGRCVREAREEEEGLKTELEAGMKTLAVL